MPIYIKNEFRQGSPDFRITQIELPSVPQIDDWIRTPNGWTDRIIDGMINVMVVKQVLFDGQDVHVYVKDLE